MLEASLGIPERSLYALLQEPQHDRIDLTSMLCKLRLHAVTRSQDIQQYSALGVEHLLRCLCKVCCQALMYSSHTQSQRWFSLAKTCAVSDACSAGADVACAVPVCRNLGLLLLSLLSGGSCEITAATAVTACCLTSRRHICLLHRQNFWSNASAGQAGSELAR